MVSPDKGFRGVLIICVFCALQLSLSPVITEFWSLSFSLSLGSSCKPDHQITVIMGLTTQPNASWSQLDPVQVI